jgi:hypothetical protein
LLSLDLALFQIATQKALMSAIKRCLRVPMTATGRYAPQN